MDSRVRGGMTLLHGNGRVSASLRLATIWGVSARVARERMDRCFADAADVVTVFMADKQGDRLAMRMAPLDAALAAWQCVPTPLEALLDSAKADAAEEIAEAEYHLSPSKETARALVKASARERRRAEIREQSLIQTWELNK